MKGWPANVAVEAMKAASADHRSVSIHSASAARQRIVLLFLRN